MEKKQSPDIIVLFQMQVGQDVLLEISQSDHLFIEATEPEEMQIFASADSSFWHDTYVFIQEHYVEQIVSGLTGAIISMWLSAFVKRINSLKRFYITTKGVTEITDSKKINVVFPWKGGTFIATFQGYDESVAENMSKKLVDLMQKDFLDSTLVKEPNRQKPKFRVRYNPESNVWEIVDIKISDS